MDECLSVRGLLVCCVWARGWNPEVGGLCLKHPPGWLAGHFPSPGQPCHLCLIEKVFNAGLSKIAHNFTDGWTFPLTKSWRTRIHFSFYRVSDLASTPGLDSSIRNK